MIFRGLYAENGLVDLTKLERSFLAAGFGIRVRYLHSEVDTLRRIELPTQLRRACPELTWLRSSSAGCIAHSRAGEDMCASDSFPVGRQETELGAHLRPKAHPG